MLKKTKFMICFFIPDETVVVAVVEFFVVNGPQGHKFVLVLDHPVEEVLNPYYQLKTKTMSQKLAKIAKNILNNFFSIFYCKIWHLK